MIMCDVHVVVVVQAVVINGLIMGVGDHLQVMIMITSMITITWGKDDHGMIMAACDHLQVMIMITGMIMITLGK